MPLQRINDFLTHGLQRRPRRPRSIMLRERQAEAVSLETWDEMQVHMKYFLKGRFPVGDEIIHTFAFQPGGA